MTIQNSQKFGGLLLGLLTVATESSQNNGKMVKLHFLPNQWSDLSHIWQLWLFDDYLPSFYVLWPVAILFGCHGNIQFWKKLFQMTTSKPLKQYDSNLVWKFLG